MRQMSIGQLSKLVGVKVTTIRYYESIGSIEAPDRSPSGRRLYSGDAVQALSFVRHGRELGFSMKAIERLLSLQKDPDQNCERANCIAQEQLGEVRKRLRQLRALETELVRMVNACKGGPVSECGVMTILKDHSVCVSREHERIKAM